MPKAADGGSVAKRIARDLQDKFQSVGDLITEAQNDLLDGDHDYSVALRNLNHLMNITLDLFAVQTRIADNDYAEAERLLDLIEIPKPAARTKR